MVKGGKASGRTVRRHPLYWYYGVLPVTLILHKFCRPKVDLLDTVSGNPTRHTG